MAEEIGSQAEAELAIERLMDKLAAWLLQQPEILLIWVQPRHVRKAAAIEIAKMMTTIPTRDDVEGNRRLRRQLIRALDQHEHEWYKGVKI